MEGPCSSQQGSWECQGMASSPRSAYPLSCQPVQPRTQRDTLCTWQWQGSILRGAMDAGRGRSGRLGATLIPFQPITNKHTVEVKKKSVSDSSAISMQASQPTTPSQLNYYPEYFLHRETGAAIAKERGLAAPPPNPAANPIRFCAVCLRFHIDSRAE